MQNDNITIEKIQNDLVKLISEIREERRRTSTQAYIENWYVFIIPLIIVFVFLYFYSSLDVSPIFSYYIKSSFLIQILTLAYTSILFCVLYYYARKIKANSVKTHKDMLTDVDNLIRRFHEPIVLMLQTKNEVFASAGKLLSGIDNLDQSNEDGTRITNKIVFLGAASLAMKSSDYHDVDEKTISKQNVMQRNFHNNFQACLLNPNVVIERYVRLFEEDHKTPRNEDILNEYASWVESQIDRLKDQDVAGGYKVYRLRRAPGFKAARSSIICKFGFVDVFGSGERGIEVTGDKIGNEMLKEINQFISGTGKSKNAEKGPSARELMTAAKLRKHLTAFQKINGITITKGS